MFDAIRSYLSHIVPATTGEELDVLQQYLVVKKVKRGDILLKEGDVANFVAFINKGLLRLYYTSNDKTITVRFSIENEFVSPYESFLTKRPTAFALDVLEDSELLVLSYDHLQSLYTNYPVFERLGRLIAEDLFIFVCQRNITLLQTPEEKYLQFIQHQPQLLQRVPQYAIASYLGITPETISRIRKKLHKRTIDSNQERTLSLVS